MRNELLLVISVFLALGGCSGSDSSPSAAAVPDAGKVLSQPGGDCKAAEDCMCVVCDCEGTNGGKPRGCMNGSCEQPADLCEFPCSFFSKKVTGARVGTAEECAAE